jgi:peptidoglycan/LPS O-acetylase OafA/YrhL
VRHERRRRRARLVNGDGQLVAAVIRRGGTRHGPGRMTAMRTDFRSSPVLDRDEATTTRRTLTLSVRVVGAAMLVGTGWIHLDLWSDGYRAIDRIGPLFLANVFLAGAAALAVLATPERWLPWAALLGGLLEIGTLGALVLSLTVGLFGYQESLQASFVVPTMLVESVGFLVLAGYAVVELSRQRRRRA